MGREPVATFEFADGHARVVTEGDGFRMISDTRGSQIVCMSAEDLAAMIRQEVKAVLDQKPQLEVRVTADRGALDAYIESVTDATFPHPKAGQ